MSPNLTLPKQELSSMRRATLESLGYQNAPDHVRSAYYASPFMRSGNIFRIDLNNNCISMVSQGGDPSRYTAKDGNTEHWECYCGLWRPCGQKNPPSKEQ